jgi:hypothetical protein
MSRDPLGQPARPCPGLDVDDRPGPTGHARRRGARALVDGASFGDVAGLIAAEALVGVVYASLGLVAVRLFEREARRGATLEVA